MNERMDAGKTDRLLLILDQPANTCTSTHRGRENKDTGATELQRLSMSASR